MTALALDGRAEDLFVGTSTGQVLHYDMRDRQNPKLAEGTTVSTRPGAGVTTLGFLIGDRTLVVGDSAGGCPPGRSSRRRGAGSEG